MHTLSLVKILRPLLKLTSGNKNIDAWMADRQMDGQTHGWMDTWMTNLIPITLIPRHYHVVGYEKSV